MLIQKTMNTISEKNNNRIVCEFAIDGFNELVRLSKVFVKNVSGIMMPHTHDGAFEITYHLKGKQNYRIYNTDGSVSDNIISGGDIFLTYPNELHGSGNSYEDVSCFYYLIIYLNIYDGFLNLNKDESDFFIKNFLEKKPRHKKASHTVKHDFEKVLDIYNKPDVSVLDKKTIQNTVFKILCEIIDSQDASQIHNNDMDDIKQFIDNNIMNKYGIIELARKCNLSESRFKQKFKEHFGIPPIEYIIRAKIDKSKDLLKDFDISITDIAMTLNFCSCSYFSKTFKRYVCISPKQYRYELTTNPQK